MTTTSFPGPGASPLWPARLHHMKITSDQPPVLLDFYQRVFELSPREITDGVWELAGRERRLLIARGNRNGLAFTAFAIDRPERVQALKEHLTDKGIDIGPSPSPLFDKTAFSVRDPDGNLQVFGTPQAAGGAADRMPARLQHAVVGSPDPERLVAFWREIGFVLSDVVKNEDGQVMAAFLRADDEHHSVAAFRTRAPKFDHYSLETTCWNDIRDWADHLGTMRIPLGWGPGRHGPGNNLFFMIADPDGNMVELSAEIETIPRDMPARQWPQEEHTLNQWGGAWIRK